MPTAREWGACLLLIVPQWCSVPFSAGPVALPWPLSLGWGSALLIAMAAPAWLALAAALNIVKVEVSRTIVAAVILGVGGFCLVLPANAVSVSLSQLPSLVIHLLLGIIIAASWALACPRLKAPPVLSAASAYLLLSAAGYAFFAFFQTPRSFTLTGWSALPLLAETGVSISSWLLWFWLFQRVPLGVFAMRTFAASAAALLPGFFIYGFRQWRMDIVLAIASLAIFAALRTRPEEEQAVSP